MTLAVTIIFVHLLLLILGLCGFGTRIGKGYLCWLLKMGGTSGESGFCDPSCIFEQNKHLEISSTLSPSVIHIVASVDCLTASNYPVRTFHAVYSCIHI